MKNKFKIKNKKKKQIKEANLTTKANYKLPN